ncbi:MAG: hypothetical protein LAT53_10150 [Idiomarina sp.]|nr:hypothetical protein [Idiomarina sp.]
MSISYRMKPRDPRSPIEKLAARIHLNEFPEEYDYTFDSIADAKARRAGNNPMAQTYIDEVNQQRSLRGISPLADNGKPTDKSSHTWALNKAKNEFTVLLDHALYHNDPMGTCCVQNYSIGEYENITMGIIQRLDKEPLHQAILNELTVWFDADLVNRPQVQQAVMRTLSDLVGV